MRSRLYFLAMLISAGIVAASAAGDFFEIRAVDSATGRGIPMVELKTVNGIRFFTDSAGRIAFHEPGLMDQDVFFFISSQGYSFPPDGFGMHGKKLHPARGQAVELQLKRTNIAERIYRITGEGIYRDSLLLNRSLPVQQPALNAGVLGSDSVLCAPFHGKLYWFWGDTQLPGYPLGLFHAPGATSPLPGPGVLSPREGVNLSYITDETGQAVNVAHMPGEGPTWLSGLTVLRDDQGRERMFAGYAKIKPPLTASQRGIAEFNPKTSRFEPRVTFPADSPLFPDGHPLHMTENGTKYIYFARPFPDVRVPATADDFLDISRYESFSCLTADSTPEDLHIDRNADGSPRFAWKPNTRPLDWKIMDSLLQSGQLKLEELPFQLKDITDGHRIHTHSGSIAWNSFRHRYVMIVLEVMGSSPLGEIWYSEAEQLLGPWSAARKVVSHENVSFYNPLQHPEFAEDEGRILYFEGTYTHTFTSNPDQTPRYEYNQIMYRLDLADPRMKLDAPDERVRMNGSR